MRLGANILRMRARYRRELKLPEENPKPKKKLRLVIVLLVLAASVIAGDIVLRPSVMLFAQNQARVTATRTIYESVYEQLEKADTDFSDFVTLTQNSSGEITSVRTNAGALNRLNILSVDAINESVARLGRQTVSVPAGTLSGIAVLSGTGPEVTFKVIPTGYVSAAVENKFEAVGINQTRHQIMLNITMTVDIVMPGFSDRVEVFAPFCVAETVIVGSVPGSFTQVSGDNAPLEHKIYDYSPKS